MSMALLDNPLSNTLMVKKELKLYKLHKDILAQILVRLPVKYILRCMCIQNSWYNLIRTPTFITLHLNHQKSSTHKRTTYHLFLNLPDDLKLALRFDDVQCEELLVENLPPGLSHLNWYELTHDWHALSHGLICLKLMCSSSLRGIYLWNPLIQKSKLLQQSPLPMYSAKNTMWEALAFGFVPGLGDYVVVHILKPDWFDELEPHPHSVFIGVYSLNTNSWKKITINNFLVHRIERASDVFINDTAFWVGRNFDKDTIVMYFDTKTDTLGEILLPEWASSSVYPDIRIVPYGQSIACFAKRRNSQNSDDWNMWVLEGNSINEFSWKTRTSCTSEEVRGSIVGIKCKGPFVESLVFLDIEEKN
ncbi:F-box domain-containing protein [Heracleum sosnowskyi]|uniref:F-box domain-containing protein n=1 Tax=Heracleum sosnowskyi TaxID=360622 RepID=A0AAD8MHA4_9APIA|nr:F-box domain-containing protein [Heracleum sosnowskyi]